MHSLFFFKERYRKLSLFFKDIFVSLRSKILMLDG